MKFKRYLAIGMILVMVTCLSGCGEQSVDNTLYLEMENLKNNNAQLAAMCNQYLDEVELLRKEKTDLSTKLDSVTEMLRYYDEESEALIDYGASVLLSDGSKAKLALNGSISLGAEIEMKMTVGTDNNSSVKIGDNVSISPSNHWTTKFIKNGVQLEHVDGISGEIIVNNGVFVDSTAVMYGTYIDKFLMDIEAVELQKRSLFVNGICVGYSTRASVNVIDGKVILDWEEFIDKDNTADTLVENAGIAETELENLKSELDSMKLANNEYEAAVLKNEEAERLNVQIEAENAEALKNSTEGNVELRELVEIADLTGMTHYSDEEIAAKELEITEKSKEASDLRAEAEEVRSSTPSPDYAEQYFVEVGLMNNLSVECHYYILYKKVDYVSVSETVDALIKGIVFSGSSVSIN